MLGLGVVGGSRRFLRSPAARRGAHSRRIGSGGRVRRRDLRPPGRARDRGRPGRWRSRNRLRTRALCRDRAREPHACGTATTSCSDLQPKVRWRQGGEVLARHRGTGARHRGNRARPGPRPREDRPGRRRPWRRWPRHGRWRRLAGDCRLDRCRARPSLRVHPIRHAKPLRARSRGRSRRRRGRARCIRQWRRAPGRPRRSQRAGLREQRLDGRLRRGGSALRLQGGKDQDGARHRARGHGPRRVRPGPAMDGTRRGLASRRRRDHGFEQPVPARTDSRIRHPPCD